MSEEPAGILLVDKPRGPTCRALLDDLEGRLLIGPLGHAGTLDPLASGLLVVLAGVARRLQSVFMASTKVYRATVLFGTVSETLDGEGPLSSPAQERPCLDPERARELVAPFVGETLQVPPAHSALRLGGQRAHRLARQGRAPELRARRVRIDAIEVLEAAGERLELSVICGPGTYLRSLARDLGQALGCGAYLAALRRVSSGTHDIADAVPPEAASRAHLLPLARALATWPRIDVGEEEARRLCNGAVVSLPAGGAPAEGPLFAWHAGEPICRLKLLGSEAARSDLRLRAPRETGSEADEASAST